MPHRNKNKKAYRVWFFLLPLIPMLLLFGISSIPETKHINSETDGIEIECFSDAEVNGDSKIIECGVESNGNLTIQYRLGETAEEPYAGAGFFVTDTSKMIDLSDYDYFTIHVDPTRCNNTDVTLHFYIPGFSKLTDGLTQRYMMTDLFIEPGKTSYDINFSELFTPSWWYQQNNVERKDLPPHTRAHFAGVSFSDHPLMKRGEEYAFNIQSVEFRKHPDHKAALFGGIIIGYLGLVVLIVLYGRRAIFVPYEKVVIDNEMDTELQNLTSFLGNNYHKEELCQPMVTRETGLKPHQIRSLINEAYGKSFKQYVTDLRMAEAKRLILETDSKIYKIAASIGYPHTSTFNHLFKETTGYSPVEFKRKHKKISS